jgi:hypothetical protein
MIKKIVNLLFSALIGWVAGVLTTLLLSYLWLHIIPVIDRTGQGAGIPGVILYVLGIVTPVALIGGIGGGLIPKEGSRKDQLIYAAIISAGLTTPVALFLFWYTGF